MNESKKILGYYDYTVILTYLGLLGAFMGIVCSINESFLNSVIFLMIYGLCDMFDGAVASTKDRSINEKHFGIQIDSLSDRVSFGVMPAVFVYMISGKNIVVGVIAFIYLLAALIRLAYFNVCEEERQKTTTEPRKVIMGVPVTTIAALLPIVYLLQSKSHFTGYIPYAVLIFVCTIGFLSPIEVKKPNLIGKICIIVAGLLEFLGIFFLGWDLL